MPSKVEKRQAKDEQDEDTKPEEMPKADDAAGSLVEEEEDEVGPPGVLSKMVMFILCMNIVILPFLMYRHVYEEPKDKSPARAPRRYHDDEL